MSLCLAGKTNGTVDGQIRDLLHSRQLLRGGRHCHNQGGENFCEEGFGEHFYCSKDRFVYKEFGNELFETLVMRVKVCGREEIEGFI